MVYNSAGLTDEENRAMFHLHGALVRMEEMRQSQLRLRELADAVTKAMGDLVKADAELEEACEPFWPQLEKIEQRVGHKVMERRTID
jgi:hypothetical protein